MIGKHTRKQIRIIARKFLARRHLFTVSDGMFQTQAHLKISFLKFFGVIDVGGVYVFRINKMVGALCIQLFTCFQHIKKLNIIVGFDQAAL